MHSIFVVSHQRRKFVNFEFFPNYGKLAKLKTLNVQGYDIDDKGTELIEVLVMKATLLENFDIFLICYSQFLFYINTSI